jgi:Druantia protein DruA
MHVFRPHVVHEPTAKELLLQLATLLSSQAPTEIEPVREDAFSAIEGSDLDEAIALHLRIAVSALCDLRSHDWEIQVTDDDVLVGHPDRAGLNPKAHKKHVRDSLLLQRNAQLAEPATRKFIAGMERQAKHHTAFRSVFSLMRDGSELADSLDRARAFPCGPERMEALREVVDPYLQVVERGTACEHTGLDLQDIWRYFRHTWVTPYRSVPGRQISFLVRDRAVANHPVIGIGSLASSVIQQKERDRWIGWHPDVFFDAIKAENYRGWSRWVLNRLADLLGEIYVDDFLKDGSLSTADLHAPTQSLVDSLQQEAREARDRHRLYRQEKEHKRAGNLFEVDWRVQAETHLFRAKRARRLAQLLRARHDLINAGLTKASSKRLERVVDTPAGRRAVRTILRYVKAAHVGVDMMDISVCGAVAPYRPILGGKLVSLLLTSPTVVEAYRKRYSHASSIIASSMAGRAVSRPPRLVLLMTTSLYTVAAAQYNRLKVRPHDHGGEGTLQYQHLAHTAGFGSYHFSQPTIDAMEILLARSGRGREVNSIFGEGVNPKLRKVRSALETISLPSDQLLKHGSKRIVYAVPLASNFRDVLSERARRPNYILNQDGDGTRDLVEFWYRRWLSNRIDRDEVLERVANHTTAYPVSHGARVPLPPPEGEDGGPHFE